MLQGLAVETTSMVVSPPPSAQASNDDYEPRSGHDNVYRPSDRFEAEFEQALREVTARLGSERAKVAATKQLFQPAEVLLAKEFEPTPWLVDQLLVDHSVTVIGAEPKSIKTWAAMELAMAIANLRTPAFGRFEALECADGSNVFG